VFAVLEADLYRPHLHNVSTGASMNHARLATLLTAAMMVFPGARLCGQQPAAPPPEVGPKIGEMAPDFEFTGITRYGKLSNAQKLSDFRGQTVVLAFFPQARSRG
jgi:peroxiredoxin Q/BCP